jgi:hypothetical protein
MSSEREGQGVTTIRKDGLRARASVRIRPLSFASCARSTALIEIPRPAQAHARRDKDRAAPPPPWFPPLETPFRGAPAKIRNPQRGQPILLRREDHHMRRSLFWGRIALPTAPGQPFGSRPLQTPAAEPSHPPPKGSQEKRQRHSGRTASCLRYSTASSLFVRSVLRLAIVRQAHYYSKPHAFTQHPPALASGASASMLPADTPAAPIRPQGLSVKSRARQLKEKSFFFNCS